MNDQTITEVTLPRRRGRPPTGQAKSHAERQREYRERKRQQRRLAGPAINDQTLRIAILEERIKELNAESNRLNEALRNARRDLKTAQRFVTIANGDRDEAFLKYKSSRAENN